MEEEEKVVKYVKNDTKIDIPPEHESPPRPPPTTHDVKHSSPSNGKAPAAEAKKQSGYLGSFLEEKAKNIAEGFLTMLSVVLCVPSEEKVETEVSRDMPNHESPLSPPPTSDAAAKSEKLLVVLLAILLVILFLPLYLLVLGASAFFRINLFEDSAETGKKPGGKKRFYEKVEEFLDPAVRLAKLVSMIRNRVLLFILLWVIINLSNAGLRKKNVLGSKLWKWTLLIVILLCGYHAIGMVIHLCLYFLELICKFKRDEKEVLYYAKGLRRSINRVIFSCSLLLIWQFYFRSDHGLKQTSGSDQVFDLGTRTLISLLIFALLWLLKSILLLKWEAHVVYKRFLDRILKAGDQLYYLAVISGTSWIIFRRGWNGSSEGTQEEGDTNENDNIVPVEGTIVERNKTENQRKTKESQEIHEEDEKRAEDILVEEHMQEGDTNENDNVVSGEGTTQNQRKIKESHEKYKKRAKNILLSKDMSTYAIQQMAAYFVAHSAVSSREDDDITNILDKCRESIRRDHENSIEDFLRDRLGETEMELLYKQLRVKQLRLRMFENCMMRAHKNCVALGHTLVDAKKVVHCLNDVLNCFVIAVFIFSWLLLTEIATTKVVVLIASPLLAASFIFGETCKTLFEGIIFAFIKHPFDVGDQCVIDGTEMEVKHVNILTTTFVRMGTKEVALYPNSVLAAKAIINRKLEPDPNDTLELSLDCSTVSLGSGSSKLTLKGRIAELEKQIKEYIKNNVKFKGSGHVMVKHIGNNIKIVVHFQHSMSILDATHSQCSEKKNKQRSEFLLQIIDYLDELNIKLATA